MDKDKERRLRSQAASLQADCDHDWKFFEENVTELDRETANIKIPIVQAAVGLVVVQVYLNGINKLFEDLDNEQ